MLIHLRIHLFHYVTTVGSKKGITKQAIAGKNYWAFSYPSGGEINDAKWLVES